MRVYNAKHCSDAEYCERLRASRRAKYRKVPRRFLNCVVCKCEIGADVDSKATVCSPACRHELSLANHRRWRKENPDKARASAKRYEQKNAETIREKNRRYDEQNREKRKATARAWKARNKPHLSAYQKARRAADPERYREYSRRYYDAHADELREAARLRREQNPEKVIASQRERYIRDRAAVELVKDIGLIDIVKQKRSRENETGKPL